MSKYRVNILFILIGVVIATVGMVLGHYLTQRAEAKVNCTANFSSFSSNQSFNATINYRLANGLGMVSFKGSFKNLQGEVQHFSVKKAVAWHREDALFIFNALPSDKGKPQGNYPDELQAFIPALYLGKDDTHEMTMSRIGDDGWIVSSGAEPYFICMKN